MVKTNNGQTLSEKIISNHCSKKVFAGEFVTVDVDFIMASDTTGPLAIENFKKMGGNRLYDPQKFAIVLDHASPTPNRRIANLHSYIREFSKKQGNYLYEGGEGVCHQLMIENHHVKEGDLVIAADSHTCTYGALGVFSTGVGATDLAGIMYTGRTWMKVPESILVELKGYLSQNVSGKDVALYLTKMLGADGASYKAIEFTGEGCSCLDQDDRLTISNMTIETGAKAGIFPGEKINADEGAKYCKKINIDLSTLKPQIATPHSVDNVKDARECSGTKINQVFLGSCTNGRLSDIKKAAEVLKDNKINSDVRFIVAPASKKILSEAIENGYISILINAGATIIPPGCGPCTGTLGGIPADDENVLSTANRNFKGRMGNNQAKIYLASPLTAAVSSVKGEITDPTEEVVKK